MGQAAIAALFSRPMGRAFEGTPPASACRRRGCTGSASPYGTAGTAGPWPLAETVSKASFCIYLTHLFFLDSLAVRGISAGTLPPIWGVPVLVAVAFGGGFLVWLVLRRVPVVNTYLI